MAQGLIALGNRVGFVIPTIVCVALVSSCRDDKKEINDMPSANDVFPDSAADAEDSLRLARQMQGLTELALPDEWYAAEGDTLAARFDAAARAMRARDAGAPSGRELMAQFENGGKPFMHSVWFFHPLRCQKCNQGGSDGFYTVTSIRLGISLRITAEEFHVVTAHGSAFPAHKLARLKEILDSD